MLRLRNHNIYLLRVSETSSAGGRSAQSKKSEHIADGVFDTLNNAIKIFTFGFELPVKKDKEAFKKEIKTDIKTLMETLKHISRKVEDLEDIKYVGGKMMSEKTLDRASLIVIIASILYFGGHLLWVWLR